jgi:hypothetical protein
MIEHIEFDLSISSMTKTSVSKITGENLGPGENTDFPFL